MAITRKEIAGALGVSPASVTKQARRGMPTDSVAAAQRWRDRHLEPSRTVAGRADYMARRENDPPALVDLRDVATDDAAVELVHRLGLVAAKLIERGAFEAIEAELRAALRAVPTHRREEVVLDILVWDELTSDVRQAVRSFESEPGAAGSEPVDGESTDAEAAADEMLLYRAAAGELIVVAEPRPETA